jgi:malonate decarboxylase epsilon subunit
LLLQIDQVDQLKKLGWQPTLVAGHSLGIFAAAYAAGVINEEDVRAKQMQECYPEDYGMGVVVGLSRPEVKKSWWHRFIQRMIRFFIFLIKIRKRRTRFLEQ